jgi:prepilin-type N-terminal cleavage/methylation domain-containing protein
MKRKQYIGRSRQTGFSLIELILVIAILSLILGAVFSQLGIAQQRLSTEEIRLDDFQQARDFVDQFFRDINQIGTPNMQIFDTSTPSSFSPALTSQTTYTYANQYINDKRFAIGLIKIDNNEIRFEGSMTGNGTVQTVIYKINGSGTCSACMQRSQVDKATADPLTFSGTTTNQNWGTEVNDVILTNPVFRFYQYDGTLITIPTGGIDYTISQADADILASVKTIQINLTIRNNNVMDKQTGLPIETSFEGEISLNNCSMVATGYPMSCQ